MAYIVKTSAPTKAAIYRPTNAAYLMTMDGTLYNYETNKVERCACGNVLHGCARDPLCEVLELESVYCNTCGEVLAKSA